MKSINTNSRTAAVLKRGGHTALFMALTVATSPAFAQFQQQVNSKFGMIQQVLIGVSGTTATIAAAYVGNKMMFQQAKWPEVSTVGIGGTIVAVASAFGAWIVGP